MAQKIENTQIKSMVEQFKTDPKGPYKDIRWFCPDGTTRPPQERCPEPGLQRARYKDAVNSLGNTNHIYLGQILAKTDFVEFWDEDNYHSRLKQYELEHYLMRTDNGWILRKAQFYRGAFQAEDEENWGIEFFNWLLSDDNRIEQNFFLVREAAKDVPHLCQQCSTAVQRLDCIFKRRIFFACCNERNFRFMHIDPGVKSRHKIPFFNGIEGRSLKRCIPSAKERIISFRERNGLLGAGPIQHTNTD